MNKGGNAEEFRAGCVNGGKGVFISGRWDDFLVLVAVSVPHSVYCGHVQGGSNMTGTDLYVNKPHCAPAVRP